MSWIPDIPPLFISLQRIESEEDLLKDSVDLFWLFCNSLMNPEQFTDRMEFWERMVEKDKPGGGGFTDSELEAIMLEGFQNPDEAVKIMLEKFESIVEAKFVEYIPDSTDPSIPVYVYLHLESARLFRLLKVQGYSDITRESIAKALNALNRCYMALESYPEPPWSWEYSISLEAVGSFINIAHFFELKIDGRYEDALTSLIKGLKHIQESYSIFDNNRHPIYRSGLYFHHMSFSNDLRRTAPWIKDVNQQLFVDCFEAIRKSNQLNDTNNLVEICGSFIDYSDEPWLSNNRPDDTYIMPYLGNTENEISNNVETEEYQWDHATEYWHEALGWVEAQITPSQFNKIISQREEQAAETRLKGYFFEKSIWERIPDRAKRSLISADRDWFSDINVRNEAILSHLSIAIEEILYHGLWLKLRESSIPAEIKEDFTSSKTRSKIRILADICRKPVVFEYLTEQGIEQKEKEWVVKNLPGKIHDLYTQRNKAEHESGKNWMKDEIGKYYRGFVGIGQVGILPRLAKLLFP